MGGSRAKAARFRPYAIYRVNFTQHNVCGIMVPDGESLRPGPEKEEE